VTTKPTARRMGDRMRDVLQATTLVGAGYAIWIAVAHPLTPLDTVTYARWADVLVAYRFNVFSFLRTESFAAPLEFYLLWIGIVAVARAMFGKASAAALLMVNWAAVCVIAYSVLRAASRLNASRVSIYRTAGLLLIAPDLLMFAPVVLGDVVYTMLATLVICAGVRRLTEPNARTPGAWLALVAASAVRPVVAPLAAAWLVAVALLPRVRMRLVIGVVAGLMVTGVFLHALLMLQDTPAPVFEVWIGRMRTAYAEGVVVFDRPETFLPAARSVPDVVRLTLVKLGYFFAPVLPGYSRSHVLINLAFFGSAYALAALAIARAAHRRAVLFLLIYIASVSLFHAMQEIDFDHRYRLPVLPALLLLSAMARVRRPAVAA
jgi:hypothetical protein